MSSQLKLGLTLLVVSLSSSIAFSASSVFISEFHYDNDAGDTGEFVEIYVSTLIDIADVRVDFYNGNDNEIYDSVIGSSMGAFTPGSLVTLPDGDFRVFSADVPGIQNGSPDGLSVGVSGTLVEFISYEGTLTAVGGIADGVTSTDIGVAQSGSTPIGSSLTRTDAGWIVSDGENTQGLANPDLTFNPIPEPSVTFLGGLGLFLLLCRRR